MIKTEHKQKDSANATTPNTRELAQHKGQATFSKKQIEDWEAYEDIRLYGAWNMFSPQAREATGLSPEEYSFVMKNFSALKAQAQSAASQTTRATKSTQG